MTRLKAMNVLEMDNYMFITLLEETINNIF